MDDWEAKELAISHERNADALRDDYAAARALRTTALEIEKLIPETFYAGQPLLERARRLVDQWRRMSELLEEATVSTPVHVVTVVNPDGSIKLVGAWADKYDAKHEAQRRTEERKLDYTVAPGKLSW